MGSMSMPIEKPALPDMFRSSVSVCSMSKHPVTRNADRPRTIAPTFFMLMRIGDTFEGDGRILASVCGDAFDGRRALYHLSDSAPERSLELKSRTRETLARHVIRE